MDTTRSTGSAAATSAWDEMGRTAWALTEPGRMLKEIGVEASEEELKEAHEALLELTATGSRLAAILDTLAKHYEKADIPEPSALHVALTQAAAAAEDLGACARSAADAVESGGAEGRAGR